MNTADLEKIKLIDQVFNSLSLDDVKSNLEIRDFKDSNREISPLRKANDAVVLDNSNLSPNEQLALALKWAKEKIETN